MLAYHSDQAVKDKYIARVRAHREADELIQGTGFDEDGRGCAVGCTLDDYDHSRYPIELGVPLQLAHLEDRLFELLDVKPAMAWPERFLSAIRPGADLSGVWGRWAVWMLVDEQHGVVRHAKGRPACEAAIREVARLWREGGTPEEFRRARGAASDAADAAAAYDAAYAASAAGAGRAARSTWAVAACDQLITLLEAAP